MKRHWVLITFLAGLLFATLTIFSNSGEDEANFNLEKVVIDAGHGGRDPGCLGSSSREKHIALSIALKLGNYIKKNFPDVEIIYTRSTDVSVELHERANIANHNKADLFISIHCNASTNSQPYGTETYVMGLHKNKDNLEVSKRENSAILYEDNYSKHYDGFNPNSPEGHIIFNLFQSAYLEQSIDLASKIQNQFKNRAKRRSRGVYQSGFLVLYRTAMPSVLIETGFLSNKTEEKYLKSDQGQTYIASAIFRAFKNYKHQMEGTSAKDEVNEDEAPDTLIVEEKKDASIVSQDKTAEVTSKPDVDQETSTKDMKDDVVITPSSSIIQFKVQIMASNKPVDLTQSKFVQIKDLKAETHPNGIIKYLAGSFPSINEAVNYQNELRQKGFEEAWVVAYKGDERISVKEALSHLQNNK